MMAPILAPMNTSTSRKKKKISSFLLLGLTLGAFVLAGFSPNQKPSARIMFYNVENLFDTIDNPNTSDDEFLPDGVRNWGGYRFYIKLQRLSQVIVATGENGFPAVIGMCEVENHQVLESLIHHTPLKKIDYGIVHQESPDSRGIDVAMLYRKDMFSPQFFRAIRVSDPADPSFTTRDILYVKGLLGTDTMHFFVNHWPSKYGGVSATKPRRALAASVLRAQTYSLLARNPSANIIIMGDLNDSPLDKSVAGVLGAKPVGKPSPSGLYNLAYPLAKKGIGTNKYRSKWDLIDQFIVSRNLVSKDGMASHPDAFSVFSPSYLLVKDENNLGEKLNRTFVGVKYNGGFSDHLPILLDLRKK